MKQLHNIPPLYNAESYYIRYTEPLINKKAVCLPSTGPANAAWSVSRLCEEWKIIKKYTL